MTNNGNRTEWSPVQSVNMRVIEKNRTTANDDLQNWTTRSPVTNKSILRKNSRKKSDICYTQRIKKQRTTARAHVAYSPFIQAWRVITLSDYKHDAFTVLLIIVMRPSAVQLGLQTYEWLRKLNDREAGVRFVNYECDYGSNWTTRSPVIN